MVRHMAVSLDNSYHRWQQMENENNLFYREIFKYILHTCCLYKAKVFMVIFTDINGNNININSNKILFHNSKYVAYYSGKERDNSSFSSLLFAVQHCKRKEKGKK